MKALDLAKRREVVAAEIISNLKAEVSKLNEEKEHASKKMAFLQESSAELRVCFKALERENGMLKNVNECIQQRHIEWQDKESRWVKATEALALANEAETAESLNWELQAIDSKNEIKALKKKHGKSANIKKNIPVDRNDKKNILVDRNDVGTQTLVDRNDIGSQTAAEIMFFGDTDARWSDLCDYYSDLL